MAGLARLLQAVGLVLLVWYHSTGMLKAMDGYFGAQFGRYLKQKLHENKHMREDLLREREEMQRVLQSKGHTLPGEEKEGSTWGLAGDPPDGGQTGPPVSLKEKKGPLGTRGLTLPKDPATQENAEPVLEPDRRLTGEPDFQGKVQLILKSEGQILARESMTPPSAHDEFGTVEKPSGHSMQQHEFCILNSAENTPPGHCAPSQSEPSDRDEPSFSTAADLLVSTEQCSSSPEPVAASSSSYSDAVGTLVVSVPGKYGKRMLKSDATNASELVVEVEVALTAPRFP